MADLNFAEGASPVELFDSISGNKVSPNADGSLSSRLVDTLGNIADIKLVSSTPSGTEKGLITNSIIYGHTTGGGGAYVEVKVTPSGAMVVEASQGTSPWVENVSQFGGSPVVTGAGASGSGIPRITVANDSSIKIGDGTTPTTFAKVDSAGRLWVYNAPSTAAIPVQLSSTDVASTPVNANEWQDVLSYTVPANYDLSITQFQIVSTQGGDEARAVLRSIMASYVSNTSTFTDGSLYTTPAFAAKLYLAITTLVGNVNDDTVTITYTNQDGTTGRTANILVKKNDPVGTRYQITLQTGDYGVRDVTNITHTQPTQAGAWNIEGTIALVYELAGIADSLASTNFAVNAAYAPTGKIVSIQYRTTAAGAKTRRISLTGNLVPNT